MKLPVGFFLCFLLFWTSRTQVLFYTLIIWRILGKSPIAISPNSGIRALGLPLLVTLSSVCHTDNDRTRLFYVNYRVHGSFDRTV